MVTPKKFIKDIQSYLDQNEIDINTLTSENIDYGNNEKILWGNDIFDFYFGATRGCFIPAYEPSFVMKFDFNDLTEAYCAIETENYIKAVEAGLGKCFAKLIPFDKISNTLLYKSEYVDGRCRGSFREVTADQIENINSITSKHDAPVLPTSWTMNFIDYYGVSTFEKFLDFIVKNNINDLHDTNIGYKNGRPIVFDYAGYLEYSDSDCNF